MQKLLDYPDTNKGFKSKGLIHCSKFNGKTGSSNGDIPNAEERRIFWSGKWSVEKKQNKQAKWLSILKEEMVKLEQQNVVINEDKVKKQCSKMLNWKALGHDGTQGFCLKKTS